MEKILVVIDMQRGTTESRYHEQYLNQRWRQRYSLVINNIRSLINRVDTVIFLIHTDFREREHLEIIRELRDVAKNRPVVFKNQDDGSEVLSAYLAAHGLMKGRLLLCGMNTDACVLRTVRGLVKKGFRPVVVGDACWTVYASRSTGPHHDALSRIRELGVSVIRTEMVR